MMNSMLCSTTEEHNLAFRNMRRRKSCSVLRSVGLMPEAARRAEEGEVARSDWKPFKQSPLSVGQVDRRLVSVASQVDEIEEQRPGFISDASTREGAPANGSG